VGQEENRMRSVSWILLTVVAGLVVLGGLGSLAVAYFAPASNDIIVAPSSLEDLNLSGEVETALRGRRGTAAAYALGFSCLLLWVVLVPYRRGDTWAWWAILCSTLFLTVPLIARIPVLGITQGATTGLYVLVVVVLALLLDVRRLSTKAPRG